METVRENIFLESDSRLAVHHKLKNGRFYKRVFNCNHTSQRIRQKNQF